MRTRISPIEELSQLYLETLINISNGSVSKISENSVLRGNAQGVARIGQKAIKDVALIEAHLFPKDASGSILDNIAEDHGIAPRFLASTGVTFLRLVATPGTVYTAGVHSFTGSSGLIFDLESNVTIPAVGYTYASVISRDLGVKVNVSPLSINQVTPTPSGHSYCVNEYQVSGGRDLESDELFRERIINSPNINAQKTLSFVEQLFLTVNQNILRVFFLGNQYGKVYLGVATQNGSSLTNGELSQLSEILEERTALTDLKEYNSQYTGVVIQNIVYSPIDLDFRCQIDPSYDSDSIRIAIQTKLQKAIDYRFWVQGDFIRWDKFFTLTNGTKGIKYLNNKNFKLNGGLNDIQVDELSLPRLRSFIMRDLDGNIISSVTGNLLPLFYPNKIDKVYSDSVII